MLQHSFDHHLQVEVADPKQKILKLGALRLGQSIKKIVPVVNKSPAAIEFQLAITPSSHALQEHNVLRLSPTGKIQLEPKGGQTKVEIIFSPKTRIPQFTEEVGICLIHQMSADVNVGISFCLKFSMMYLHE